MQEWITLMNADSDKPIPGYENLPQDVTIRLSQLPTRNINFTFDTKRAIKSLSYAMPGNHLGKRGHYYASQRPFSLGRDNLDLKAWTPARGVHPVDHAKP